MTDSMDKVSPVFKCRKDNIEAHHYKTIAENMLMVQCFACGARAVYNTSTHELTPYHKNRGRVNEFNLYLEKLVTDSGRVVPLDQPKKGALDDR